MRSGDFQGVTSETELVFVLGCLAARRDLGDRIPDVFFVTLLFCSIRSLFAFTEPVVIAWPLYFAALLLGMRYIGKVDWRAAAMVSGAFIAYRTAFSLVFALAA